jgi:hypothetical protein
MLNQLINNRLRGILSDFIYFDEFGYNFTGAVAPCAPARLAPIRSAELQQTLLARARLRFAGFVARVAIRSTWPRAHRARARACAGGFTLCQVLLENVRVKESAFAQLDLPIRVKSGVVGKLDLGIPYRDLYTKPVRARAARGRPPAAATPSPPLSYNPVRTAAPLASSRRAARDSPPRKAAGRLSCLPLLQLRPAR